MLKLKRINVANNHKMAKKYASYTVSVKHPETGADETFTHGDDYDSITLTRLVNFLGFANDDKDRFNANFMSVYNE